jgi:hypothetical protein
LTTSSYPARPSPNKFAEIEKPVENHPELVKSFLDDRFTRWLVENVSGYIERTLQLSRLQASEGISTIKGGHGWQGCIGLRTAQHAKRKGIGTAIKDVRMRRL